MRVLSSGTYQGSRKYNADIIGLLDNMYYVFDGSTALFDDNKFFKTGDLLEYMKLLNKNIKNESEIKDDLKKAIRLSNEKLVGMERYKEYELPTYTIAVIKDLGDKLEYYILCDTLISILYKDGHVENIQDKRIDPVKNVCRTRRREILADTSLDEEERMKLIIENEQVTRMKANAINGFPVGSTREESIDMGYIGVIDKEKVDRILICTDGYYDSEEEMPSTKDEFDISYVQDRVQEILSHEKRDDMTYILLEV